MAYQIKTRNGTASSWTSANPILLSGEIGVESDTGKFKLGNGTTAWNSLAYAASAGAVQTNVIQSFGAGSDGNVTISSGTTVLARDMYYNNLTINGTGSINPNGYRIFVANNLDLTAAPVAAISVSGANGGNASGATGGTAPAATVSASIGAAGASTNGASGTTGAGAASTAVTAVTGNGGSGLGGTSGAGGTGTNAGAAGGAGVAPTAFLDIRRYDTTLIRNFVILMGGQGARGGSSGGGDGTNSGGGGGAGGGAGGVIALYAKNIIKSSSTPSGVIQSNGGNGGNGGNGTAGITGGGGGGAGGSGGWIYICYQTLGGPSITSALQATGGNGGAGGSGFGAGSVGGAGGGSGSGGRIILINTLNQSNNEVQYTTVNSLGSNALPASVSGTLGGGGGLPIDTNMSL